MSHCAFGQPRAVDFEGASGRSSASAETWRSCSASTSTRCSPTVRCRSRSRSRSSRGARSSSSSTPGTCPTRRPPAIAASTSDLGGCGCDRSRSRDAALLPQRRAVRVAGRGLPRCLRFDRILLPRRSAPYSELRSLRSRRPAARAGAEGRRAEAASQAPRQRPGENPFERSAWRSGTGYRRCSKAG